MKIIDITTQTDRLINSMESTT